MVSREGNGTGRALSSIATSLHVAVVVHCGLGCHADTIPFLERVCVLRDRHSGEHGQVRALLSCVEMSQGQQQVSPSGSQSAN